jgi:hypothetical protein
MFSTRHFATGLALSLAMILPGCGGGGAKVETTTTTVSLGQQLIDLKNARDNGSISPSEYNKMREDIIKNAK